MSGILRLRDCGNYMHYYINIACNLQDVNYGDLRSPFGGTVRSSCVVSWAEVVFYSVFS